MDAALRLHASIEKELSEFVLDRNDLEETLPPLRRRDDDYDEIERCIKNLAIRPGYSATGCSNHAFSAEKEENLEHEQSMS